MFNARNILVWIAAAITAVVLSTLGAFLALNWVESYGTFWLTFGLIAMLAIGIGGHRLASDRATGDWGGALLGIFITVMAVVIAMVWRPPQFIWADAGRALGAAAIFGLIVATMAAVTHFTND
jgi:hypothetical protein